MRVDLLKSIDFNQMLVMSVFFHFFLITLVLFLPKPKLDETLVVPAFMVEMLEEVMGQKEVPSMAAQEPPPAPVQKEAVVKPPPPVKKTAPPKPPAPDPVMEALKKINEVPKTAVPAGLLEELEEVAKLEAKRTPAPKPVVKESLPVIDETFKELEALKEKTLPPEKSPVTPPVVDDPLMKFEDLKMKTILEPLPVEKKKKTPKKLKDDKLEQLKLSSLTPPPVTVPKKTEKTAADLLEELSKMKEVEEVITTKLKTEPQEVTPVPVTESQQKEVYESILSKLETLDVTPMEIDINMPSSPTESQAYQSELWKIKVSESNPSKKATSNPTPVYVHHKNDGPPASDPLSLYIGAVRNKIYKNWKEPLAEKFNKQAIVSFTLFPMGNIDKPYLKQSAGVEQLDTLAIRAVMDSEPFPKFPAELKVPNLSISIQFKYVPEKS